MAIVIRQFSFSDAHEAVINLWSKAGEGIHPGPSDDPEEIKKKSDFDPGLFLVAEKDEGIVGSAIGGFDGRRVNAIDFYAKRGWSQMDLLILAKNLS